MSERVIIVGLKLPENRETFEESMEELDALVESAGAEVIARVDQAAASIDPRTFIGRGKAEEIRDIAEDSDIDTIVLNYELSGSQIKNLEEIIDKKIIDRTSLILDIFAFRAKTVESVLQVKLAQANYRLPRLVGYRNYLSRTGGGIGTRGPGEQKLETDRRHIRREMDSIKARLKKQKKNRSLNRKLRKSSETPVVALLGYTNAGKSTIMNRLLEITDKEEDKSVYADDRLFATLDTSHRRISPEHGKTFILSDTVGLIRDIPVNLIEAFKSTLEGIAYADLILIVLDASSENLSRQKEAIRQTIDDMDISDIPKIEVFNKMDVVEDPILLTPGTLSDESIFISALEDEGINKLLESIESKLSKGEVELNLLIPYDEPALINNLIERYKARNIQKNKDGMKMTINVNKGEANRLKGYEV
ncbi:MAG: GTPase HflX [Tissierellia bacterium]|nr:GTPase HflX [Tissierellia bacterium]